jgi:hypothetical protein
LGLDFFFLAVAVALHDVLHQVVVVGAVAIVGDVGVDAFNNRLESVVGFVAVNNGVVGRFAVFILENFLKLGYLLVEFNEDNSLTYNDCDDYCD